MQQLQCDTASTPIVSGTSAIARLHADMLEWKESAHWMIDYLHRIDGKRCPYCGVEIVDEVRLQRWYQGERIKCSSSECGRFYTSRTNTELDGSTLDARELFLLKCLIEMKAPAASIITIIPINKETVERWAKRFQAMEQLSA